MPVVAPCAAVPAVVVACLAAVALSACTAQQGYATGQAWQRNECNRIPGYEERRRCLERVEQSYEAYRRDAQTATDPK
ncbi:MAG: hypothetical protein AB7P21_16740 [Lautropia sp.]